MNNLYLVTGCSGGGKSTLIEHLAEQGYQVVHEAGLRVIRGNGPKPWDDRAGFIDAAIAMCRNDLERFHNASEPVFFDRGLFDGLSGLAALRKQAVTDLMLTQFPYAQPVFHAPPWPEIFEQTSNRPHTFEFAREESDRLWRDLKVLGVKACELPKTSVQQRVQFILDKVVI